MVLYSTPRLHREARGSEKDGNLSFNPPGVGLEEHVRPLIGARRVMTMVGSSLAGGMDLDEDGRMLVGMSRFSEEWLPDGTTGFVQRRACVQLRQKQGRDGDTAHEKQETA